MTEKNSQNRRLNSQNHGLDGLKDDTDSNSVQSKNQCNQSNPNKSVIQTMRYEYKNTGIEWLSNIPKHWKAVKLKRVLNAPLMYGANESAELDDTELPRYIRITDFGNDGKLKDDTFKSLPIEKAKDYMLTEGDVLFARSGATVGKTFQFKNYNGVACFAGYLIKATPRKWQLDSDFLYYYTKSIAYEEWKNIIFTQATIQNIGADKYQYLDLTLPPLPEQRAIADYLDKACQRIDSIIEIKQKQLERIEGYLITKITDWVTKGLSLSETETTNCLWIPVIKKGWKIKSLKRMLAQKLKYGANESAENEDYDEPRYIRITDFGDDGNLKDDTFKSLPLEVAEPYMLQEGDVLFARSGATVGKTFIFRNYKGLACYAGYLIKANCDRSQLLPEYLYYFTKSKAYQEWKNIIFTQATIQNIGADKYQYLLLPQPKIEEQKEIIKAIASLWEKTENLKNKLNEQISTLQTYRKSLIHECVTGKKQVWEGEIENWN
jgi:type I restriction enzyme S subunit